MQIKILVLFLILLLIFLPFVQSQQVYYVKGSYFNNNVNISNNANSLASYGYLFGKTIVLNPDKWAFEIYFKVKDCTNTNEFVYIRFYNTTRFDGSKTYAVDGITFIYCRINYIWFQPISGAGITYTSIVNPLNLQAKYHVVIVFDKPTLYFYVNGSFIAQYNVGANTLYNSTIGISVGGLYGCLTQLGCLRTYGANATLYLLRVYNTTLTSSQVTYNFNAIKNFDFENYYSNYLVLYYAPFSVYENRWVNIAQNDYRTDIILVNTQLEDLEFYYAITTITTTIHNQLSFNLGAIGYLLAIVFIAIGAVIFIYMARNI